MTQSMQDFLIAAESVIGSLLGTEVTPADIAAALQTHCSDWSDPDQESVLTLAAGIASRIADICFESAGGELKEQLAYPIHYSFVAQQIEVSLGRASPLEDAELRREAMIDRRLKYPFPVIP